MFFSKHTGTLPGERLFLWCSWGVGAATFHMFASIHVRFKEVGLAFFLLLLLLFVIIIRSLRSIMPRIPCYAIRFILEVAQLLRVLFEHELLHLVLDDLFQLLFRSLLH